MNKNDSPLTGMNEILDISFDNLEHRKYFKPLFTLVPEKNEKIVITNILDKKNLNKRGLVYCFVIDGILLKVGSTTTSMKARVQSYNCGKESYRKNGTCSTTNYFVLQTFLNIGKEIEVFAYFPEEIVFDVFGHEEKSSLPAKYYEKTILSQLKKNKTFPTLCTQT